MLTSLQSINSIKHTNTNIMINTVSGKVDFPVPDDFTALTMIISEIVLGLPS